MSIEASVIIPLLHQEDSWLDQAVRSALAQTAPIQVIVIVSNCTPTSNIEILEAFSKSHRRLIVQRQPSKGFANALNEGIRISKTNRVGFLLSDDWLMPTAVERCLNHNTTIVSTSLLSFAADGKTPISEAHSLLSRSIYDQLQTLERKANYLSHFFLIDRDAILDIGGVDETIGDAPGIDDYDLIWTLLEQGATVSIVKDPQYCYRDHHLERLTLRARSDQVCTLLKIFDKHGVHEPDRSILLDAHSVWFGKPVHVVLGRVNTTAIWYV